MAPFPQIIAIIRRLARTRDFCLAKQSPEVFATPEGRFYTYYYDQREINRPRIMHENMDFGYQVLLFEI